MLLLNLASTKKKKEKKENEPDILYCAMRPVWRHFIVIKATYSHQTPTRVVREDADADLSTG